MGLFSFNTAPGKGIDKNAPKKKGIFRYFEILLRKFTKLWKVNMMYFLLSLPFLAILTIISPVTEGFIKTFGLVSDMETIGALGILLKAFIGTSFLVLLGSGPASAGYAYITRCFTREEHAWIFSDFKDKFKENFKQGIFVSVFDILAFLLIVNGLTFYYPLYLESGNPILLLACCFMILASLILIFSHFYIYQLMVTFNQTLGQLYRNSVILALANLPQNVFFLLLTVSVTFISFYFLSTVFSIVVFFIIGYSLLRFPIEYYAARVIEKKILPNVEKDEVE